MFSDAGKLDREGAGITMSVRLFRMVGPATGKARLPAAPADDWYERT